MKNSPGRFECPHPSSKGVGEVGSRGPRVTEQVVQSEPNQDQSPEGWQPAILSGFHFLAQVNEL